MLINGTGPKVSAQVRGWHVSNIDPEMIVRKYGNATGTYLEYVDGSTSWIDPETGIAFWYIASR